MELHPATLWPAQIHGSRRFTWRDFDDRAARLADALAAGGVGPGSKVGQLLYNTPEFIESYFAALKLRAVPFNLNYRYTAPEVAYLLRTPTPRSLSTTLRSDGFVRDDWQPRSDDHRRPNQV